MTQRNTMCSHPMLDFGTGLSQSQSLHPEPCAIFGNIVDFPSSNMHPIFSAPRSNPTLDLPLLTIHHDANSFYGLQHRSTVRNRPVTDLDLGRLTASNVAYNTYMDAPSSSRMNSFPFNHGYTGQYPSSGNHGVRGINLEEHGRINQFVDNGRGSCKRKNVGLSEIWSAGSSSSLFPYDSSSSGLQHFEESSEPGLSAVDTAISFNSLEHHVSEGFPVTDGISHRSVRSRSNAASLQFSSVSTHRHDPLLQENYMSRSFQSARNSWVEQFGSNGADRGSASWHYGHSMSFLHGGSEDVGNSSGQGYRDSMLGRTSGIILPQSLNHTYCFRPEYTQNLRAQNYRSSSHLPENFHGTSANNIEPLGFRPPRYFPSSGDHYYRPHRRMSHGAYEDMTGRMSYLSQEDITILEFSGLYGAGNFIDEHRGMRLDIDEMSYEELLALEERIGDVSTGLSEEAIAKYLKTRFHKCCPGSPISELSQVMLEENGTCIICQVEYTDGEKIGSLECGHEYHADCIKQWLLLKNVCPICKMTGLLVDSDKR